MALLGQGMRAGLPSCNTFHQLMTQGLQPQSVIRAVLLLKTHSMPLQSHRLYCSNGSCHHTLPCACLGSPLQRLRVKRVVPLAACNQHLPRHPHCLR